MIIKNSFEQPMPGFVSILFALSLSMVISANANAAKMQINILKPTNSQEAENLEILTENNALDETVKFINDAVSFDYPVTLSVGAEDGPLFDPAINDISLPFMFVDTILTHFESSLGDLEESEQNAIVLDVVTHTLLHETAHALIAQLDIPIVGKEEDAADALATMLLLEYHDSGTDIALTAADMFALEDQSIDQFENADYWGVHSLDIQRYYSTLCYIAGNNDDERQLIIEDELLSEDKADECIDEYALMVSSWEALLGNSLSDL